MLDGKYRVDRLLAVGGMGAVYMGTHVKLRKRIAIKVLNPQLSSGPMIERFHREAITASQIGHEGIAQVTDIGTSSEGEPFLVMEYLEGESLASRLRTSGPLSVEDACELGCSILSPLAAAHRAGIVHRDLKPDNVYLVRQSRGEMVKLLDFGISRDAGLESEFRLTTTGLVLGTPYYMSPEQARGESDITPAADIYAFGVILYEMLVGDVPIRADNYNQLMYRVMVGDYTGPRERRPDLPEALDRIIVQSMSQEPAKRPASATELEQALLPYCRPTFREHLSGRMSAPGLPAQTPPPVNGYATGSGLARSSAKSKAGTDHTAMAGSPGSQVAAVSRERPSTITTPRRSRMPWIAGAIIGLAGIAGAVVVLGRGDPPVVVAPAPSPSSPSGPAAPGIPATVPATQPVTDAASATPSEPPVPSATPDAGGAEGSTVTPQATTITLRFAVEPASAVILLDGAQIKAAELVVPKDGASHTLRITAPGHVAHDETIRFDESQRLVVQLRRVVRPVRGNGNDRHKQGSDTERIDSESPY